MDVDQLIIDEGLNDNTSSTENPDVADDSKEEAQLTEDQGAQNSEGEEGEEKGDGSDKSEESVTPPTPLVEPPKTQDQITVEARTLFKALDLTEDKVLNERGEVTPFKNIINPGEYISRQVKPVTVTDKEGKTHVFNLLSEVEEQFPNGFEAKNNIEQLKFNQAIMANETAFRDAVNTYNNAEKQYQQEVNSLKEERANSQKLSSEYESMANAGLVPKHDASKGDKSEAVAELTNIMAFMETKNAELAKMGVGRIDSLYVAKQLMDIESKKEEKNEKKEKIITQRTNVASLGKNSNQDDTLIPYPKDVSIGKLADMIIEREGLR
jgi:hypothetical protein